MIEARAVGNIDAILGFIRTGVHVANSGPIGGRACCSFSSCYRSNIGCLKCYCEPSATCFLGSRSLGLTGTIIDLTDLICCCMP